MPLLTVPVGQGIASGLQRLSKPSLIPPNLPKRDSLVVHRNGHHDFQIPSVTEFLVHNTFFPREFSEFVAGHPLESLIQRPLDEVLTFSELQSVLEHVDFELACNDQGVMPASTRPESSYSKFAWTRDMANKVLSMIETGDFNNAKKVIYNLAEFYNEKPQRDMLVSFHWHPDQDAMEPAFRYAFEHGSHPPIRAAIADNGKMVQSSQGWAHNQFDAMGAWLYVTFYMADILGDPTHPRHDSDFYEPNFLRDLDHHLSFGPGQNTDNDIDSIFSVAFKSLNRVRVWDNYDVGAWEDVWARRRTSSIGICLAAAKQAKSYLEKNDWQAMKILDLNGFQGELQNMMHHSGLTLDERIPNDGREAVECDVFPSDAALSFLLYPYNPGLSGTQELAILRSLYNHRVGPIGITRRNDDEYLGMDYHTNNHSQGIYANKFVPDFKGAEWAIFDPYLSTYFVNRTLSHLYEHGTIDRDALELSEFHLRRSLSHITRPEGDRYVKRFYVDSAETLHRETVNIDGKKLPEAFFFDSYASDGEGKWRANENSPLLWTEANFLIMIRKQMELKAILESFFLNTSTMEL